MEARMYKLYGNNPNVMVKLEQNEADILVEMAERQGVEPGTFLRDLFSQYLINLNDQYTKND